MRKGHNGGTGKKNGKKRLMIIVVTTSLPAVDSRMPTTGTPHPRANSPGVLVRYDLGTV